MPENNPLSGTREAVTGAVRIAMARQKMSGRALAERIGMSQSSFSRLMTCETAFTVEELADVAAALECTVAELVGTVDRAPAGAA
jgi:DNA-binding Xre family transcriptional regulator